MAANRIYLQVDLNSSSAQQNVNALNQSLAQTGQVSEKSSAQATSSLNRVTVGVKSVTSSFDAMGAAIAGLGIERLAASMLKLGSDFGRIQLSIEAFTGSAEKARDLLASVRQIADRSPFEALDLEKATQKMVAFGIATEDIPGYLTALSNKMASTGASMEDFQGIVNITGRIIEKDFVGALDLLRKLPQQAFPIMKELQKLASEALGKPASVDETKKAIEDGIIPALKVVNSIYKIAADSSKNFGEKINDGAQAFKVLSDHVKEAAAQFVEKFNPALVRLAHHLEELLTPLAKFAEYLENLPEGTKDTILEVAGAFTALAGAAAGLKLLATVLGPLWTGLKLIVPVMEALGVAVAALDTPILVAAGIIAYLGITLYEAVPAVKKFTDSIVGKISDWVGDAKKKFHEMFESVRKEAAKPPEVNPYRGPDRQESESILKKQLELVDKFQDEAAERLLQAYSSPLEAVTIKYAKLLKDLKQQFDDGAITKDHQKLLEGGLSAARSDDLGVELLKKRKENMDELDRYQTEKIKGSTDIQIAYIEAQDAQSLQGKIAAIDKITELRIHGEDQVAAVQKNRLLQNVEDYKQFIESRKAYLLSLGATQGELDQSVIDRGNEAEAKIKTINQKASDEAQKYRLEGWKKANDVIIEDQKRVYDSFRDLWGEFFDAITGKAGNVGKAIGDMFKKLAIGELKETFANQLAALSTQAAGYGLPQESQPQHGQGLLGILLRRGTPPRPAEAPPQPYVPDASRGALIQDSFYDGTARFDSATLQFVLAVHQFTATVAQSQAEGAAAALAPMGPGVDASMAAATVAGAPGAAAQNVPWYSPDSGFRAGARAWMGKTLNSVAGMATSLGPAVGFPKEFTGFLQASSQKYNDVDPALALAVMKHESNFNPNAVGPVTRSGETAVGLGQFMPGTAAAMGLKDRTDPAQSIDATFHYLHDLQQKFPGDTTKVLAAYSAGPGAVMKYGGIPPFKETQDYVPAVMGLYRQYSPAPVSAEGYAGLPPAGSAGAVSQAQQTVYLQAQGAPAAPVPTQQATITPVNKEQLAGLGLAGSLTSVQFPSVMEAPQSITLGAVPPILASIAGTSEIKKFGALAALGFGAVSGQQGRGGILGKGGVAGLGALGNINNLKSLFGIGIKPDNTGVLAQAGIAPPWLPGQSTTFKSVATSPAVGALATAGGLALYNQGLQKRNTPFTAIGGGLAGAGLALQSPQIIAAAGGPVAAAGAGLAIGGGVGLLSSGLQKGGGAGVGLDVAGGALTGAGIGFLVGGPVGALIGAGIGAAAGAVAGLIRLGIKTETEKIRAQIKSVYGIDISDQKILAQVKQIIDQSYGGNVAVGIRSQQVQDIVRLYALSTGQAAGLPRPEYSATITQSAASGNQLQQVYQGGQLVQNPYSGPTTYQYQTAVTTAEGLKAGTSLGVPGATGQVNTIVGGLPTTSVVAAIQSNPAAVANASAAAARAGDSRMTTSAAMLEPLTALS